MKKSIIAVAMLFMAYTSNAQETYGSYQAEGVKHEVLLTIDGDHRNNTFVSMDKDKDYLIVLDKKNVNKFKADLTLALEKYKDWRAIALKNKVQKVIKTISTSNNNNGVMFKYSDYEMTRSSLPINFKMQVYKGKPFFLIATPELVSFKNEYITKKIKRIYFDNAQEVQELIDLLDQDKHNIFINGRTNTEDLFN